MNVAVNLSKINLNSCEQKKVSEKNVPSKCRCPRCGTPLVLKGGRKGEAKAKAKLLLTMRTERTYIYPKCGYSHQSHTIMVK